MFGIKLLIFLCFCNSTSWAQNLHYGFLKPNVKPFKIKFIVDETSIYYCSDSTLLAPNTYFRLLYTDSSKFKIEIAAYRCVRSNKDPVLGNFVYQVDYMGYKNFGGAKLPATTRFAVPNISWTRKILEVKNNAAIEDAKFIQPAK